MLKLKLVDCEHWDIFAVLQGRQGHSKKQAKKGKLAMPRVSVEFARQAEATKKKRAKGAASRVKSIEDAPAAACES